MNRQYFVSYVIVDDESDDFTFDWTVVSRDKLIETAEDLENIQSEIEFSLWEKIGSEINIRLVSWRRMEQE